MDNKCWIITILTFGFVLVISSGSNEVPEPKTTTVSPDTTTHNATVPPKPTTPTTIKPSTNATIPPSPSTKPTSPTTPTSPTSPTSPTTPTSPTPTTAAPTTPTTTPSPTTEKPHPSDRKFDAFSFIGGFALAVGLLAIGFLAWKLYISRRDNVYHTL